MHFVLNAIGGFILVAAAFAAIFIAGNFDIGDGKFVHAYFPLIYGACICLLDAPFRIYGWRSIVAFAKEPNLLTPDGAEVGPRQPAKEAAEALFSSERGGQFFHILPAWLLGVAVIVMSLANGWGLIGRLLQSHPI